MRHRWINIGVILSLTGWLWAGNLSGARVLKVSGSVQSTGQSLEVGHRIEAGRKLVLAAGSRLEIRYRQDGHREIVEGPGVVTVGPHSGSFEGAGKLQRLSFQARQQSAPGQVNSEIPGGLTLSTSPLPKPIVSAYQLERRAAVPVDLPLESPIAWEDGSWTLPERSYKRKLEILDERGQAQDVAIPADSKWRLDELDLQEEELYRVRLDSDSLTQTFRLLNDSEVSLLQSLATSSSPSQTRMFNFGELGLYHLAAQEGEQLLRRDGFDESLLEEVVSLYEGVLGNPQRANQWRAWGKQEAGDEGDNQKNR
jgi:hypothetical protein